MNKESKRTTVTINRYMAETLKNATIQATIRSGTVIKQSELINYLINHKLSEAIDGVIKEKQKKR